MRPGLLSLAASIPSRVLTNNDLAQLVDTNDDWIVSRTGIRERRLLADGETIADHGARAVADAVSRAGLQLADIDLLIACTYTPDRLCPSASCDIHGRLGLGATPAMDVNAACTGFLYGIHLANHLVRSGAHRHVAIVGLEAQSRFVDYTDRATCILFGDGAAAAVVGPVDDPSRGILATCLGADGRGAEMITFKMDGPADPSAPAANGHSGPFLRMNGREVFKFAVRMVSQSLDEGLALAGLQPRDIDLLVPHQANLRIITAAAERLTLPPERVLINIERYGNTAAASIPIALLEAEESGRLKRGMTVALVGFGAGFTYGSAIIKY